MSYLIKIVCYIRIIQYILGEHFITSPSHILKPNEKVSFDNLEVIGFHKLGDYNIVAIGEAIN